MTTILKGCIVSAPALGRLEATEHGYLIAENGHITGIYPVLPEQYAGAPVEDYGNDLIVQSFADLHLHAPQYPMLGTGMDLPLLDWLNTYAFPTEARFADTDYARTVYRQLSRELIAHGTTRVCMFSSLHTEATLILMEELERAGVTGYVGKVNMDRNSPDYLREASAEASAKATREWIRAVAERHYEHVQPILTPRFTPSCSDELMELLHDIQKETGLPAQSHLSENLGEIESVLSLCPGHADYLEVYERAGLLTDRSIFGHCVHLTDREYKRLGETGGIIAHCPTSNLFLGSGLFDMREANRYGVRTTLATDVGAGTSFSMWRTMGEAYKVQQLNGYPMTALEAIYKCTLGSARALSLDDRIGSFLPGREADFIVVDYAATSVQKLRMEYLRSRDKWTIENKLFGLQTLGDDRNTVCTYIMGKQVYGSDSCDHQEASM